MSTLNQEVSAFLDTLAHPLRAEIQSMRNLILDAHQDLNENVKWNGPNYVYNNIDCITMKIMPPKQVQIILHRGAKKLVQPKERLIQIESTILEWKENDRAVITLKNHEEITKQSVHLKSIIYQWVEAQK